MVRYVVEAPYVAHRVNTTTFLIVHNDRYKEYPFVYAKLHPRAPVLVLVDTGCGPGAAANASDERRDSARDRRQPGWFDNLKTFIEEFPVADNAGRPLNPAVDERGRPCRKRAYLVVLTHVHFDHIGGVQSFAEVPTTKVLCSGFRRSFVATPEARRENSLVRQVGMALPEYRIARFLDDGEDVVWPVVSNADDAPRMELRRSRDDRTAGTRLGLRALHTPGHTPDSLSIYDEEESWLYTGDSFYERWCSADLPWGKGFRQAIIFPDAGSWEHFVRTLQRLIAFVDEADREAASGEVVRLGCAHTTAGAPAAELLQNAKVFFHRWARGAIPVRDRMLREGIEFAWWQDDGDPEFSVVAPTTMMPADGDCISA